jgi:hypothetical protein
VQALVQHVDHGTTELVPVVRLFSCPSQFSLDSNPPFANLCFLSGVDISLLTQSKDGEENAEWRTEASQSFLRLIHGHPLSAKVKKTDRNGSCHVMLYILSSNGKDKVCVNSSLQSTLLTCSSDLQQVAMPVPQLPQFAFSSKMDKLEPLHLQGVHRGAADGKKWQKESPVVSCKSSETKTIESLAQILGVPQQSLATKQAGVVVGDQEADTKQKLTIREGVFLAGPPFPRACTSVKDAPFEHNIVDVLKADLFPGPTPVQSHCWMSILRGRDVVGVSRSGTGKTLAYLLPLLSMIHDHSQYCVLPQGIGPLVVILCPYWKKASYVYNEVIKYSTQPGTEETRSSLLYGGRTELTQVVSLLNGCDVLVSTPHALLRAINQGHTSLTRLCHIVFDDADILAKRFSQQVSKLMSVFADVLRGGRGMSLNSGSSSILACSCQKLVFTSSWTSGVSSLISAYLANPFIAITSRFDAMIYCKVLQVSGCKVMKLCPWLAVLQWAGL